jgi:beta-galactosidase/beta-glucuronidase
VGVVVLTPAKRLDTWSPLTPITYTVIASIDTDEVAVPTAVRVLEWKNRAHINGPPIMLKGFSHHNSFGGVGSVIATRLQLFQVQSARALGANFIRNAHSSYSDDLYEILTELGMMAWDESREFAVGYAGDFHDQVKQHRGHASVCIWSFCNELSCSKNDVRRAGAVYRAIAKSLVWYMVSRLV